MTQGIMGRPTVQHIINKPKPILLSIPVGAAVSMGINFIGKYSVSYLHTGMCGALPSIAFIVVGVAAVGLGIKNFDSGLTGKSFAAVVVSTVVLPLGYGYFAGLTVGQMFLFTVPAMIAGLAFVGIANYGKPLLKEVGFSISSRARKYIPDVSSRVRQYIPDASSYVDKVSSYVPDFSSYYPGNGQKSGS